MKTSIIRCPHCDKFGQYEFFNLTFILQSVSIQCKYWLCLQQIKVKTQEILDTQVIPNSYVIAAPND